MKLAWQTKEIGIVVFNDVLLTDVVGPSDVFSLANSLSPQLEQPERYRINAISSFGGEVCAVGGLRLQSAQLPAPEICAFDTVLIAGGPGVHKIRHDMQLRNWLRAVEPRVSRIGSVCTGAYILADTGLLSSRSATTHWNHATNFSHQFPAIRLKIDAMYVRDGKFFTSAGGTAGLDLALSLVDEDFGRDLAMAVARELVVSNVRSSGQTQFSAALASYGASSDRVRRAAQYILSHLEEETTTERVAEYISLSARQLTRQFSETLGMSLAQFISAAKVDLARELICGTQYPYEKVALRCGFSGRVQLNRVFEKATGMTPDAFRKNFNTTKSEIAADTS